MSNVHRLKPLVGTVMSVDDTLILPTDIMEELGWEALVIWECELKDETQALEKASAFLDDGY